MHRSLRSLLFSHRFGGVTLFLAVFVTLAQVVRVALLYQSAGNITWDASLPAAWAWGLLFDIGAGSLFAVPWILLLIALPERAFAHSGWRIAAHLAGFALLFLLLFEGLAEWVFWDEFSTRFNFIAVDYLVYTTEVIRNIVESYPLPKYFLALGAVTLAGHLAICRSGVPGLWFAAAAAPLKNRLKLGGSYLLLPLGLGLLLSEGNLPEFANNYHKELAKNGLWSFAEAFRNNQLDYNRFYLTIAADRAYALLHRELEQDGSTLVDPAAHDSLRRVAARGPELHPNVVQITVESLSYAFLGSDGKTPSLTPNLDELKAKSLVFDNFYATGTRTDRGMEALALSLPPTPGRSLIKRPRNENLFTLGSVFRAKGYDTAFIYGGYGYFDNMNYFFGNNGYRIVDRNSVTSDDVTFANAWGACDEDLFRWTLREADNSYATGKPFHFFVMTTSNHRPYTFPAGRIDLPSKTSGRSGAVKYTDFAIGQLLRQAASHPWFNNTIFVIVADHCASSAGRMELPVKNYHIPLIIYAPGGQIAPGRTDTLTSQMDYAPTLLGLLHWTYLSRFFGHDVVATPRNEAHALIGTYQKVGHLEDNILTVLKPVDHYAEYTYSQASGQLSPTNDRSELQETISFYQTASEMYRNGTYAALVPDHPTGAAAHN